jgi:MSHA pilin protein MshC
VRGRKPSLSRLAPFRGFTLIELVTSIVLIGILSAIAAPRFFDSNDFAERGYADEVASTLRLARKVAIASDCEVRVTLGAGNYVANQRSTLAGCETASGGWATPVHRGDGSLLAGTAPNGVTLAPPAVITFARDGSAVAPNLTIGMFILTIDPISGMVTVSP